MSAAKIIPLECAAATPVGVQPSSRVILFAASSPPARFISPPPSHLADQELMIEPAYIPLEQLCRESAMSSDPKEYRANALRCARLAEVVTDKELKTTLTETAQAWLNLARKLERAQGPTHEPSRA